MDPRIDLDAYHANGFVLVHDVFDADTIAALRRETDALLERASHSGRQTEATWRGAWRESAGVAIADAPPNTRVDSIHNVQNHSAEFTRVLVDPRLTDLAAELIGPNVQLHHTKLHAKPPAVGSPFPMHQDYPYFPHANHTMIAAIIHLDDAKVDNGCLCAVPGSHKLGPIVHRTDNSFYLDMHEWPLERAEPVEARAGDVLLFSYFTVHGSYVNASTRPRRILLVQLRAPDDLPTTDQHRSPGQGTMLRGINPNALEV
jgi:ectoine hydroxylase-related dioxygenase (phytanoyl-CoA dioxygenase family)